jgi:catechol 2,3-dioxygenase-like lactoylglutathione lyase family enzyme
MLLHGIDHVATLTKDSARLIDFYREVFEAELVGEFDGPEGPDTHMSVIAIGDGTELNVFEVVGNTEADHQVPMFGRGRIDHIGLRAKNLEAFDEIRDRLMRRGAADAFVSDFGVDYSLFFRDPDGLEGEVLVTIPVPRTDEVPPRGTTAHRYAGQ